MQKIIKINGTDITSWTPPTGYIVTPRYINGNNGMVMLNGDTYEDEVAIKSDVELPFMPLTDAQLGTLMQTLHANATCSVYFFDPDVGVYRTMVAHRQIGGRKFRGKGADGQFYWTGVTVTFKER